MSHVSAGDRRNTFRPERDTRRVWVDSYTTWSNAALSFSWHVTDPTHKPVYRPTTKRSSRLVQPELLPDTRSVTHDCRNVLRVWHYRVEPMSGHSWSANGRRVLGIFLTRLSFVRQIFILISILIIFLCDLGPNWEKSIFLDTLSVC